MMSLSRRTSLVLIFIASLSVARWRGVQAQAENPDDIILTPEQQASIEAAANVNDPFAPQNAVVRNERSLWPDGQVPYIIDDSLSRNSAAITAINAAIEEYRSRTCVRFVQRTNQLDYVRFFAGNGCYSYIGRIGGPQDISIGRNCEFRGIVMHEMFHALGRWHEQSRPDRDMYVRINRENIQAGVESNFEITSSNFVTTQGVPYDLSSIMHYGARAFSRNGQPTIEPLDSRISLNSLGQRNGFSSADVQHVIALYCGDNSGPAASWGSWGSWSSCSRTCNGGTRSRVRTCNNGVTCEGSNIDMQACNTASCPTPASWGQWGSWSSCSASCGTGRQERRRQCVNGNTCSGASAQFRNCNEQSCPQPQSWGPWGSWSSCSSTCQGGRRLRRRTCQNGNTCPGADFETEFCNTNVPCVSQPNPNTGEWGQWSQCTRSCGGGFRFRSRMCGTNNCDSQQEECNTQDCNPEPELRGLQHVGCSFVPPRSSFIGLLEGSTDDLSDNPFSRTDPIRKCGTAAQQRGYRYFAISVGYCISGSSRLSDYQYFSTTLCRNGVGNFIQNYFIMDIYEIASQQSFLDSISGVGPTTVTTDDNLLTTTSNVSGNANQFSSSSANSFNFLLLVCSLVITLSAYLL